MLDVAAVEVAAVEVAAAAAAVGFWLLHKVQAGDNNKFIIANSSRASVCVGKTKDGTWPLPMVIVVDAEKETLKVVGEIP